MMLLMMKTAIYSLAMDETGGDVAGPFVNYMREDTTTYFYTIDNGWYGTSVF